MIHAGAAALRPPPLALRFGTDAVDGKVQARVVAVEK